jgi:hypothetical protein
LDHTKLIVKTAKGSHIKVAATLEYRDGRIWFVKSPFALKDEIKAMKGAKWHGFEAKPVKQWSVLDCPRNRFQLAYMKGENVYEWFEREIVRHEYTRPLGQHQKDMVDAGLTFKQQIFAAEMGCISGDAIIHVKHMDYKFHVTLRELHEKFEEWCTRGPVYVKSLTGDTISWNVCMKTLYKGVQETLQVRLSSGKSVVCTLDHEIYTDLSVKRRADSLSVGDTALSCVARQVCFDTVVGSGPAGKRPVYDLVMDDPYRNFVADGVVVSNCGKTLAAQEIIERSRRDYWLWVGPKATLPNCEREMRRWEYSGPPIEYMTYEGLVKWYSNFSQGDRVPDGIIIDEASKCKTATSQRSIAAQGVADLIREADGYVIEMSGTPSPKRPTDWWSLVEIAFPGFLREGSPKAMQERMAFLREQETPMGKIFAPVGWRDDENKCHHCGGQPDDTCHDFEMALINSENYHAYEKSINEVSLLFERLAGLVIVKHKKDCLNLPDKRYRVVDCEPTASTKRAAKVLVDTAPNTITGLTLLRELSDGFVYREEADGMKTCNICDGAKTVEEWFHKTDSNYDFSPADLLDAELAAQLERRPIDCPQCNGTGEMVRMVRVARQVKCPKEDALVSLLEECDENGRIVIFAGFTGSVDRCCAVAQREGWSIVRCDGRGYQVTNAAGEIVLVDNPIDYWADRTNEKVAFISHPESGGMGLTLTESRMIVFYSNSFKPEYRTQAEDRIHRPGMDENLGCEIVDLCHLPTDKSTLVVIKENRRLELMTLGELAV